MNFANGLTSMTGINDMNVLAFSSSEINASIDLTGNTLENQGYIDTLHIATSGQDSLINLDINQNAHSGSVILGSSNIINSMTVSSDLQGISGTVNLSYTGNDFANHYSFDPLVTQSYYSGTLNLNLNFSEDLNLTRRVDAANFADHLVTIDNYNLNNFANSFDFTINFSNLSGDIGIDNNISYGNDGNVINVVTNSDAAYNYALSALFSDAIAQFNDPTTNFFFEAIRGPGASTATGYLFFDLDANTNGYTEVFKFTNIDYTSIDTSLELNNYVNSILNNNTLIV